MDTQDLTGFNQEKSSLKSHPELEHLSNHDSDEIKRIKDREHYDHLEPIEQQQMDELLRRWYANEMFKRARSTARDIEPDFVIDDFNRTVFEALCLYHTQDKRFEERGYGSLNKGIFLVGNVGAGKTLLMKAFAINKRRSYVMNNCAMIADGYSVNGVEHLQQHYYASRLPSYLSRRYFFQDELGACYDDLGIEQIPSKHFGNEVNAMEKLILYRYQNEVPFNCTHFTSNLDANQVEALYGTRIRSRLREMCNFLELGGSDRRK
jgi:DNA replication protein DnaC